MIKIKIYKKGESIGPSFIGTDNDVNAIDLFEFSKKDYVELLSSFSVYTEKNVITEVSQAREKAQEVGRELIEKIVDIGGDVESALELLESYTKFVINNTRIEQFNEIMQNLVIISKDNKRNRNE